jgi:hypothetical protein
MAAYSPHQDERSQYEQAPIRHIFFEHGKDSKPDESEDYLLYQGFHFQMGALEHINCSDTLET